MEASRATGQRLVIEVADDGPGFPRRFEEGTGLANLRERLVTLYGDDAELRVDRGGPGSRVMIGMPAMRDAARVLVREARPRGRLTMGRLGGKRWRVLIVDDEAAARRRLSIMLDELDIEVVGEAENGMQALELSETRTPDLLLLDISMPEVDGFGRGAPPARPQAADRLPDRLRRVRSRGVRARGR